MACTEHLEDLVESFIGVNNNVKVSRPLPSAMFCSGINGTIHIAAMLIFMILRIKSYTVIFHFKDYPSVGGKNVSFMGANPRAVNGEGKTALQLAPGSSIDDGELVILLTGKLFTKRR
ncbi:hypothetical protein NC652_035313 [Populus alba x Populus x berolinensis]|nr:hypothetical protein NC652_035313 [Populus alba x Populus x berolinensis]